MKSTRHALARTLCAIGLPLFCLPFTAHADLQASLRGYFNFQTDLSDSSGNGVGAFRISGVGAGAVPNPVWPAGLDGTNPSGPGFGGNSAFNGGDGLSNRGTLLAGNALNLVDARNEAVQIPLGTAELGQSFTISAWTYLAPGATNLSPRFFAFEATNNFDTSWGMPAQAPPAGGPPLASVNYAGYLGEVQKGPLVNLSSYAWHHVVHTFTAGATDTTLNIYVDGALVITGTNATSSMNFDDIVFGRQRTTSADDRDWDGMVDEIGIWNRPLGQADVSELYALGSSGQSVVPEPASAALFAGACGLLLARRRRHRHA